MPTIRALIPYSLCFVVASAAGGQEGQPPVRPAHVQRLVDALGGDGAGGVTIRHLEQDAELCPSIRGDTCVLRVPWSALAPAEEELRTERVHRALTELPARQRRAAIERATAHTMQVWFVPLAQHPAPGKEVRKSLKPHGLPNDARREIVHLGNDEHFAWYAAISVMHWPELQSELDLASGDDPMDMALARLTGPRPELSVARLCYRAVAAYGRGRAISAIDGLIFDGSAHRGELIRAMSAVADQSVTDWLISLVSSPDAKVAYAARWALLEQPHPDAAELYVAWLAEGAGRDDVCRELLACIAVGAGGAAGSLPAVLDKPASLAEYLAAFRFHRELAGQPIDEDVVAAAADIMSAADAPAEDARATELADRTARAVYVLTTTDDTQAAAAMGIELAVCKSDLAVEAGVQILADLPDEKGKKMVQGLAAECRDRDDSRRLSKLALILGLDQPGPGGGGTFTRFNLRQFDSTIRIQPTSNIAPARPSRSRWLPL